MNEQLIAVIWFLLASPLALSLVGTAIYIMGVLDQQDVERQKGRKIIIVGIVCFIIILFLFILPVFFIPNF